MRTRIQVVGVVMAAATMSVGVLPATAAITPGDVRVSKASPYAGCSTPPTGGAVVYPQAEVEPRVASNPLNPNNLIGAWQQDRWSTAGAHGLVAASSFDGGKTWRKTTLPFSRCTTGGLPYDRASDPWVSIGPDGTAYVVALALTDPFAGPSAIAVATSRNGGRTWGNPHVIQADVDGIAHANDKESVTADPTHAGTAYVVWDRCNCPKTGPHFRVPTMFSKTTDGGLTWSAPKAIAAMGQDEQSIGNAIVVDSKTHTLYNFYNFYFCTCVTVPRIEFVQSSDGGATWSAPRVVHQFRSVGVTDPNTNETVRTEDFAPDVAIDPSTGAMYLAWQDARLNGGRYDEVVLSRSTDGGTTWSPPRRASSATGRPAFTPTVAVSVDGTVAVTYYDLRRLAAGEKKTLPTDYWLRTSRDGGRTFSADQHVAGPFNMKAAPVSGARGFFIGDYMGLTSVGDQFVPFFVQTNCVHGTCPINATDVYAALVTPLPAGADQPPTGPTGPPTGVSATDLGRDTAWRNRPAVAT